MSYFSNSFTAKSIDRDVHTTKYFYPLQQDQNRRPSWSLVQMCPINVALFTLGPSLYVGWQKEQSRFPKFLRSKFRSRDTRSNPSAAFILLFFVLMFVSFDSVCVSKVSKLVACCTPLLDMRPLDDDSPSVLGRCWCTSSIQISLV